MMSRLFSLSLVLLVASSLPAADIVNRRSTDQREGGTITRMTKTEVAVQKQVGGEVVVPVNDISYIEWDSAPPGLGLGRAAIESGNLGYAQSQLETAQKEASSGSAGLQGDIQFLLARVAALNAMSDTDLVDDAREKLNQFLRSHRDHYRHFDAQLLLGDVALAAADYPAALTAYTAVSNAPWKDYQMAAQIGNARTMLAQDKIDAARREFEAVVAVEPQDDAQKSRRLEGLLGQAECLQRQQQFDEVIRILDEVIDQTTAKQARLQAQAYLLQGDTYVAMGANPKQAIMAYLHVDVIPAMAREKDLHAEALYHLSRLWGQVGQENRARNAAAALRDEYPDSQWAEKLGG